MDVTVKRRRRWILWAFVLIVACFVLLLAALMNLPYRLVPLIGDAMDWKSHYLAGLSSVNCGRVTVRGDASAATQCALQAQARAQPFRVIYNIQGWDSIVAGGIVRTPGGALLALSYDSCPYGCGFSLLQQRVQVAPCPQPYQLYVNPKGRINCFQPQLSYPKNIMSPNADPY
jgi:hypothetical protein